MKGFLEPGRRWMMAFVFLLTVTWQINVHAAGANKSDFIVLGINAGYSTLLGQYQGMKVLGGFSGGMHFGYEFRTGNLWLGTTGEFRYLSSNCRSEIQVASIYFQDTRMTNAQMNYEMLSPLRETQNFAIGEVGLMAGYCKSGYKKTGYYFGAGIRIGCKFDMNNRTSIKYRTEAVYEEYIDPYEDMPNHYYTYCERNDTVSFGNKLNVTVVAEGGWDLRMKRCDRVKVGLFIEAGVTDIMKGVMVREPVINKKNVTEVTPYSAYNREAMAGRYVIPIVAGIRISLLFNVSRVSDKCHTCPCYRKN